jgi:hypothetical protein
MFRALLARLQETLHKLLGGCTRIEVELLLPNYMVSLSLYQSTNALNKIQIVNTISTIYMNFVEGIRWLQQ